MEGYLCMVLLLTFFIGTNAQNRDGYNVFGALPDSVQKDGGRGRGNDGRSVQQCIDLCDSDSDCGGFDFDHGKSECFTFTISRECNENRRINRNDNCCTHYQKQSACCTNDFVTATTSARIAGGTINNGADSDEECQSACCSDPNCVAASYNYDQRDCYIHDQGTDCTMESATNFVLYTRGTRCSPVDRRGFRVTGGQTRQGGVQQNGITNENECLRFCRNQSPENCAAMDWNQQTRQCFSHNRESECNNALSSNNDATHFTRIEHTCDTSISGYDQNVDRNVQGGRRESGSVNSANACANRCNQDNNCGGFDWDGNNGCWLHLRDTECGDLNRNSGVDHWRKINFCDGGSGDYTRTFGRNRQNGQRAQNVNTVSNCESACNSASSCGGFDFTRNDECWLHSIRNECDTQLGDNSGVDHYRRNNLNCQGGGSSNFQIAAGNNAPGGQLEQGIFSQSACDNVCGQRQGCGGYDWNENANECWLHSTSNECANRANNRVRPNNCCDHYSRINLQCGVDPPTTCNQNFISFTNQNRLGASQINNMASQTACVEECCRRPNCAAVDWNPSGQFRGCWEHTISAGRECTRLEPIANVNHWRRPGVC